MKPTDEMKGKSLISSLCPFSADRYQAFSLASLTAYSVFWLNENGIQPTLENVAVANYKMFPAKYAMVGWPMYPDFNRTNRALLQMRPKYRNMATSSAKAGVYLTKNGILEAKSLFEKLGNPLTSLSKATNPNNTIEVERGTGKARTMHPEDVISRIRESALFKLYEEGKIESAEPIDLIGLLGVYDHTPSKEKRAILSNYSEFVKVCGDIYLERFLNDIQGRFRVYLSR